MQSDVQVREQIPPPHPIVCEVCESHINDVPTATVAWHRDGFWIVAHSRCVFRRRQGGEDLSEFDWGLSNVIEFPMRYTMYAMFTIGREKRTATGITSWYETMEKIVGYPILERDHDEAAPDSLPATAGLRAD